MKKMRRLSLLSLVLVFSLVLSACSTEANLGRAFKKQQEITTAEASTKLKFNLKTSDFDETTQEIIKELESVINSSEFQMNQTSISNKKGDELKGKVDLLAKVDEKETGFTAWVDMSTTEKGINLVEILKFPKEFMDLLEEEGKNKDYIIYDFNEVLGTEENINVNMDEILKWATDAQPKLIKFVDEFGINSDMKLDIVKSKGKKDINGEKLDIYEINLNDKEFKDLIKYTGNKILEDEDMKSIFKEYMDIIVNSIESDEEKVELKTEIEDMKLETEKIKEKFNELMEEFKDIQLIGEKGIKLELGINNKGYISHEKGYIDLLVDLSKFTKDKEIEIPTEDGKVEKLQIPAIKGKINLGIEYETKIFNINNKNLKVEFPKVDEKNSIKFSDIMKNSMEVEINK